MQIQKRSKKFTESFLHKVEGKAKGKHYFSHMKIQVQKKFQQVWILKLC